eukprot:gene10735-22426_t
MKVLCKQQEDEFKNRGVLVIPGVLSEEEIISAREGLHSCLLEHGVEWNNLLSTAQNLVNLSSTGGAGGILDIFYEDWKLKLNEHPKVVSIISQLWAETYSKCEGIYTHPFGSFNSNIAYMYIDRICFRVPENISDHFKHGKKTLQRTLAPHLDCCPQRLYESDKEHPKWRPIQAFIALTDTLEKDQGGFEACPGLHTRFDEWVANRPGSATTTTTTDGTKTTIENSAPPPCVGDFTPIRPKEDADILALFEHIPCRAGDMVCWDFRIPHANARKNTTHTAREVVYIGLLPDITMNRMYAEYQLQLYRAGQVPMDQWHEHDKEQSNDYEFSPLGRQLMAMESWERNIE